MECLVSQEPVAFVFMVEVFKFNLFMCVLCRPVLQSYTVTRNNVSFSDSHVHQHRIKISLTEFSKAANSEDILVRVDWRTAYMPRRILCTHDSAVIHTAAMVCTLGLCSPHNKTKNSFLFPSFGFLSFSLSFSLPPSFIFSSLIFCLYTNYNKGFSVSVQVSTDRSKRDGTRCRVGGEVKGK